MLVPAYTYTGCVVLRMPLLLLFYVFISRYVILNTFHKARKFGLGRIIGGKVSVQGILWVLLGFFSGGGGFDCCSYSFIPFFTTTPLLFAAVLRTRLS